MKGDFTGIRRWPEKHYASVRLQQGRVQLDADWNDQIEIQNHLDRTEVIDAIGAAGGPKGPNGGFHIAANAAGTDLSISAGRFWVDGLLCEANASASYLVQPELPSPPDVNHGALALADGTYVVYLDAWERLVTSLEDADLREPALRGVDTTTRTKVTWQVKLLAVTDPGSAGDCATAFPEWGTLVTPPSGMLRAQVTSTAATSDQCSVDSDGGYTGLENQLYRVEIHQSGTQSTATFKWSRENASVVTAWTGLAGNVLAVSTAGRDAVIGFTQGNWVELTDDEHELSGVPGPLVKLTKVSASGLTIDPTSFDPPGTVLHFTDFKTNPKVRRWEGNLASATSAARPVLPAPLGDGYVDLESGVRVKFENGTYRSGDYWVVPARVVLGSVVWPVDASNTPLPKSPLGVAHHFARLALVHKSGTTLGVDSCYPQFPPLTAITADDVSVDCTCDSLVDAKTVQQALDILCSERDLAFHNEHLHGWGIVCGLQVACGPDSAANGGVVVHDTITVKNGYALDTKGNDIVVSATDASGDPTAGDILKILDLIKTSGVLSVDPTTQKLVDGSVSLFLKGGADVATRYGVEAYDGSSQGWDHILDGTFWWDVLQDCIKPIIDAFKAEFLGNDGASYQHIVAFANLLAQLFNPSSGARVFISPKEDQILRDFYTKLRNVLQSETFCAMFDGITSGYPQYDPIYGSAPKNNPRPSTIMGNSFRVRERLRVNPAGTVACLVSTDSTLELFDVQYDPPVVGSDGTPVFGVHEKLLATVQFPTAGAVVQDVAFSKDGNTLYVIALLSDNDALFATADVSVPASPKWTSTVTTLCQSPLVTLGFSAQRGTLYAVGTGTVVNGVHKGGGLFQIDPDKLVPNQQPIVGFNAFGHLVVVDTATTSYAYVTVGTVGTTYSAVGRVDLGQIPPPANGGPGALPYSYSLSQPGKDDIAAAFDAGGKFQRLFVVVNAFGQQTSKQMLVYDAVTTAASAQPVATVALRYLPPGGPQPSGVDGSAYRLGYEPVSGKLLIVSTDACLIQTYDPAVGGASVGPLVQPIQLAADGIAVCPTAHYVFALNGLFGTITSVPTSYFAAQPQVIGLPALASYHSAALKAFVDLFGQLAQYLKDCVCHHFLVNCPDGQPKTIYLARLDIKAGGVYNICNFSRRKYVHSFPTVEYWMSIVPVLPVIRQLVGELCCGVLQQQFKTYQVEKQDAHEDYITGSTALNAIETFRNLDVSGVWKTNVVDRASLGGSLVTSLFGGLKTAPRPKTTRPAASLSDVRNQPSANVAQTLTDKGIVVAGTERATGDGAVATIFSPTSLDAGSRVTLVTDSMDRVIGFKSSPAPTIDVAAALADRDRQIAELGQRLQTVQTEHAASLAQRDEKLNTLSAQMLEMQKTVETFKSAAPR